MFLVAIIVCYGMLGWVFRKAGKEGKDRRALWWLIASAPMLLVRGRGDAHDNQCEITCRQHAVIQYHQRQPGIRSVEARRYIIRSGRRWKGYGQENGERS